MTEYLSPQQYSERFQVPLKTVYRWVEAGQLPILPKRPGTRLVRILVTPADRGESAPNKQVLPFVRTI